MCESISVLRTIYICFNRSCREVFRQGRQAFLLNIMNVLYKQYFDGLYALGPKYEKIKI